MFTIEEYLIDGVTCEEKGFRWIGTCNELDVSYAAVGDFHTVAADLTW